MLNLAYCHIVRLPPLSSVARAWCYGEVFLHKRKLEKEQLRRVRNIILQNAFCDNNLSETVNTLSHGQVLMLLPGPVNGPVGPDVEKGEVLVDSRGRGSFQQVSSVVRKAA
jgi:hypothetical protein